MIINIIEWIVFILLFVYWCYGEKRKLYLYDLWTEHY